MRPFSKYLEKIKSEVKSVDFNLSGTTPPLIHAQKILRMNSVSIDLAESRGSESSRLVKNRIASISKFDEENIEFFPGTSQAIFQLFASIANQNDSIVVETPTYAPVLDIAKFLGLKILRFKRTANFEEDLENLKKLLKKSKLAFLTNPHCPTGYLLNKSQIERLDKLGRPIILDEIYLPHFSTGKVTLVPPAAKNLISVSGLSKTLGISSARLSWALGPKKYLTQASRIGFNLTVDMPTSSYIVGALSLDKWNEIISSIGSVVDSNRQTLNQYMKTLRPYLSHDLKFGHFATIEKPKSYSSEKKFLAELEKQSIFLRPGSDFEMKNHFRFHLMMSPSEFRIAIDRIASLYEEYKT